MRSLDDVMAYRNDFVLDVFRRDYMVNDTEIEEIFALTKQWLYLGAKYRENDPTARPLAMPPHIIIADKMWHSFMLTSIAYTQFCDEYFGRYIHHQPVSWSEIQAAEVSDERSSRGAGADDPVDHQKRFVREELDDIAHVMSMAYDVLGPETTEEWFVAIPERYPRSRVDELRRPGF